MRLTRRAAARCLSGAALLLGLGACLPLQSGGLGPAALRDWPSVLAQAQADASARRYADADRLLAEFAQRYPGTPEAQETSYWRAFLRLDPQNQDGSLPAATASLDEYLKGDGPLAHRTEAEVLRRIAGRMDVLSRAVVAAGAPAPATPSPVAVTAAPTTDRTAEIKARDAEIQRLKDELSKANDELERIKKRLTQPTKPPA